MKQGGKARQPQGQQQPKKENIHQYLLIKTAHERGWKLRLTLMNGEKIEGILKGYENYSFTLQLPSGEVVCYFKHAIASFEVIVPT